MDLHLQDPADAFLPPPPPSPAWTPPPPSPPFPPPPLPPIHHTTPRPKIQIPPDLPHHPTPTQPADDDPDSPRIEPSTLPRKHEDAVDLNRRISSCTLQDDDYDDDDEDGSPADEEPLSTPGGEKTSSQAGRNPSRRENGQHRQSRDQDQREHSIHVPDTGRCVSSRHTTVHLPDLTTVLLTDLIPSESPADKETCISLAFKHFLKQFSVANADRKQNEIPKESTRSSDCSATGIEAGTRGSAEEGDVQQQDGNNSWGEAHHRECDSSVDIDVTEAIKPSTLNSTNTTEQDCDPKQQQAKPCVSASSTKDTNRLDLASPGFASDTGSSKRHDSEVDIETLLYGSAVDDNNRTITIDENRHGGLTSTGSELIISPSVSAAPDDSKSSTDVFQLGSNKGVWKHDSAVDNVLDRSGSSVFYETGRLGSASAQGEEAVFFTYHTVVGNSARYDSSVDDDTGGLESAV